MDKKKKIVTPESVDNDFNEILNTLNTEIERLKAEPSVKNNQIKFLKGIYKQTSKLQKNVRKVAVKPRTNKYTGFTKLTLISDEMADFLGLERGSKITRTQCTSGIHKYIVANGLQNPLYRRQIYPNEKLKKLLRYDSKNGPLLYTNMQKLIQVHFKNE